MENFLRTTATKKAVGFWSQVVGAVWMTTYILNPSPLPCTDTLPVVAWLCLLVAAGVTLTYIARPWFAGYFALFALMALYTTRRDALRFRSRFRPRPEKDDLSASATAIREAQQTQSMKSKLASVDGRTKTLEEMLVDEFVPLGKTYLAGGGENIRTLPVMLLP